LQVITSKEREVTVTKPDGEKVTFTVQIWNETVSNLTLMALGSSAPEIMLSVIEVVGKNFEAGDLGPNTIVGSAAFNLFMIIAICVWVIPSGEVRRQKHLDVFFVTATWSVFAYAWLYLIIAVVTPGRVDIWEVGVMGYGTRPGYCRAFSRSCSSRSPWARRTWPTRRSSSTASCRASTASARRA